MSEHARRGAHGRGEQMGQQTAEAYRWRVGDVFSDGTGRWKLVSDGDGDLTHG